VNTAKKPHQEHVYAEERYVVITETVGRLHLDLVDGNRTVIGLFLILAKAVATCLIIRKPTLALDRVIIDIGVSKKCRGLSRSSTNKRWEAGLRLGAS